MNKLDKTFLEYFRKHAGVYSQADVEKIVKEEQKRIIKFVENNLDDQATKQEVLLLLKSFFGS